MVKVKSKFVGVDGLVVVIVYRHPQLILDFRGLSADLSVDVHVPVDYFQLISRQSNQPFDEVNVRFEGILEHYHIPALGFKELINTL